MPEGKDQLKKEAPFTFFPDRFYDWAKRLIDVFLALLVLIGGLPILVLIVVLIKMESRGPVFFLQNRVGKKGKIFKMFKFRTMIVNAESILSKNPVLFKEYQQMGYKLKNDPRITSVGRFLRKYSLDELPQVINILRGEMSVVGPRAYKKDELETQLAKNNYSKRYLGEVLSVKPGLTGVWQISGRSEINFKERIYLDFSYATRRSILYDLLIILKTIPAVFKGKGAW
jgi:lipopolysaccharide/colanic/teichoic acid biosynthesis glycosyltransferase